MCTGLTHNDHNDTVMTEIILKQLLKDKMREFGLLADVEGQKLDSRLTLTELSTTTKIMPPRLR